MVEKKAPIILSSRWLGPWRWVLFGVYVGVFGSIVWLSLNGSPWEGIFQAGLYGYFFWMLVRMTQKLQRVSFDREFLYVQRPAQELLIPLANIKAVEIATLGGVYKVTLFSPEQLGEEFFFKPSILYPLNFQKKDALVNQLRTAIEHAKREERPLPKNALAS